MPITFKCLQCGKPYKVKMESAGKRFKCKGCDETIRVPQPKSKSKLDFEEEDEFSSDLPTRKLPRVRRKRSPNKSKSIDNKLAKSKESPAKRNVSRRPLFLIGGMIAMLIGGAVYIFLSPEKIENPLIEKAMNHLAALTEAHQNIWNYGTAERWDADQNTGIITWTFPDGVTVKAPFQIIGTYNSLDSTFLWGWDHPSIAEPLTKDAKTVLAYAQENNLEFLTERKIECSEEKAWEMTAIANLLCDQQGAYRGPAGTAYVYMTFGKVSISKDSPK